MFSRVAIYGLSMASNGLKCKVILNRKSYVKYLRCNKKIQTIKHTPFCVALVSRPIIALPDA